MVASTPLINRDLIRSGFGLVNGVEESHDPKTLLFDAAIEMS
jgi:hypothetical protein